jgi:hypothetical protein
MNTYSVVIEDVYDKTKTSKIQVQDTNVFLAHKQGLYQTNALREEIVKIISKGKTVFTLKGGFCED